MLVVWLAAISIALPSIFFDCRERRIPNALIASGLLLAVSAVLYDGGVSSLANALLGGLVAFLAGLFFWLIGWLGAGDVKLIGVFGILIGLPEAGAFLINVGLTGAVLALTFLIWKGGARTSWQKLNYMLVSKEYQLAAESSGENGQQLRLPYAIAVVAGAFATMLGLSPIG
ncbi:prepilin peptidase [Alcanivorax sp. S6407]|uniref:A24 family peptidase n=1 Tax=Alcanivorax sp. S6407 TaxID=2926424 RepID=UPI001FF144D4|nr:prepilin peptidase [Alcanivorax sp. S6407]MCK0153405.1 prepilin peptidase [Alcanivorax sp. S6407]